MDENTDTKTEKSEKKRTKEELVRELHEYSLVLHQQAINLAHLAAALDAEPELTYEDFVEKCKEHNLYDFMFDEVLNNVEYES